MPRRPQNVYDDPEFFAGYAGLDRFGKAWGAAFEHASFTALLPSLTGVRALDLGCGAGQLALYLAEAGAAEVIGLDASERMLDVARAERSHPRVTYQRMPIEEASFPEGRFELVVSSLALHYVEDYPGLVRRIGTWLPSGGSLVFSTEHPIFLARATDDGWIRDAAGEPIGWAIDAYAEEGLRTETWFRDGVETYRRTMATLLNGIIDAGLTIERVVEAAPTEDQLRDYPDWIHERRRPIFLLIRAGKGRV